MSNSNELRSELELSWQWRPDRDIDRAITSQDIASDCETRIEEAAFCECTSCNRVSASELAQLSGVSELEICAMVDYCVLTPSWKGAAEPWHSPARCVLILRRAQRLRDDLAFDGDEFALALMHIFELKIFEAKLRGQRAGALSSAKGAAVKRLQPE